MAPPASRAGSSSSRLPRPASQRNTQPLQSSSEVNSSRTGNSSTTSTAQDSTATSRTRSGGATAAATSTLVKPKSTHDFSEATQAKMRSVSSFLQQYDMQGFDEQRFMKKPVQSDFMKVIGFFVTRLWPDVEWPEHEMSKQPGKLRALLKAKEYKGIWLSQVQLGVATSGKVWKEALNVLLWMMELMMAKAEADRDALRTTQQRKYRARYAASCVGTLASELEDIGESLGQGNDDDRSVGRLADLSLSNV